MSELEQFIDQSYLNLQTFRKNGQAMSTPVWFIQDDNTFYIRTYAESGKVKRVRNNPEVRIMPCGQVGEPLGKWVGAKAHETQNEDIFAKVKSLMIAKYGNAYKKVDAQAQEVGQKYTILVVEPLKS